MSMKLPDACLVKNSNSHAQQQLTSLDLFMRLLNGVSRSDRVLAVLV